MAEHSSTAPGTLGQSGIVRAAIGLAQGIALYLLFDAFQSKSWPATDGPLFAALATVCVLTPLVAVSSLSYLRLPHLIGWTLATAAICAGLAWYGITRDPTISDTPRNLPSWELGFSLAFGLFIAHCLVVAGCIDRRVIARYPTYFDVSWKYGVQAILAALFTLVLWLLLLLGAELFKLIRITVFSQIIQKDWFWIPVTTLSVTYAMHTTDVRVGIVRGVRSLSCNLLSWLLPLMALIGAGFLVSLPFTGLEPLWSTRRASSILLAAAASLIFLINAAYQDGTRAEDSGNVRAIALPLRVAMLVASLCLVPLAALSAYGITLRVGQYGWTPDRVIAMACAVVAACYALGYIIAAIRWPTQFRAIEIANIATAFVIVAILLCLLTPIADPARISVASQIDRLTSGKVSPEQFDYRFLRFFAGRYGQEALQKLSEQDTASAVATRAKEAQALRRRYEVAPARPALTAVERARTITVVQPQGQSLPQSFLEADWRDFPRRYLLPSCLSDTRFKCDAVLADLDDDGTMEIILMPGESPRFSVYGERNQRWTYLGELANNTCPGVRDGLKAGTFELAPTPFKDVIVRGERLRLKVDSNCLRAD